MHTHSKGKLLGAAVGILIAVLPIYLFTTWLESQGEAEVSIAANWSIAAVDLAIDRAVQTLQALANRGVDSCSPDNVERLRQAVFAADTVKEIAVVEPSGKTLCTDAGGAFVPRDVLATAATSDHNVRLDVIRPAQSERRLLRVRLLSPQSTALAALLPQDALLPQLGPNGTPLEGTLRLRLADGTPFCKRW